ncbi:chromate transporter [Thomasclavelia sp.]
MNKKILLKLFITNLYLSAFTFGGGYVIVTLMKKKYVDELNWIEEKEMLDLIAIAQSAPGAIAVNGAIVIGFKLAGILGALVSILATIIPPFIILSLVSIFYEIFKSNQIFALMLSGMQAGVGAIIASVTYDMAVGVVKENEIFPIIIMVLAFIVTYVYNISVIYVILSCGVIGVIQNRLRSWRKK